MNISIRGNGSLVTINHDGDGKADFLLIIINTNQINDSDFIFYRVSFRIASRGIGGAYLGTGGVSSLSSAHSSSIIGLSLEPSEMKPAYCARS